MKEITKTVFVADDGKEFLTPEDALAHERFERIYAVVFKKMNLNSEHMSAAEIVQEFVDHREALLEALK